MKIGFDARMITHPGIGSYIRYLLHEMVKQAPEDEFVLFGDPEALRFFETFSNVNVIEWKAPIYSIQEQILQPYDRADIDLLHVPHFNIPIFSRKKIVVTIHDLIYLLFPSAVSSPFARGYAKFMIERSFRKAEKIIAVSENTKSDLAKIFGNKAKDKTKVIYEASGEDFNKVSDSSVINRVKDKYSLSDRVILYVGSVKPHKNVATLIKVFEALKQKGIPHELVIAGKWDKKEDYLKEAILQNKHIRYIGEVPREDLISLYSLADALVHLSLYEGFGLTVLEAMRCGLPVVASNTSSLSEVAGEAALTVSPLDVGQVSDTVYNVLVNKELREKLVRAGLERIKNFSWAKTAKETLKAYRNII